MEIDMYFKNLWHVHANNGKQFDSMWTTRAEARKRKAELTAASIPGVQVNFVSVNYGDMQRDSHS